MSIDSDVIILFESIIDFWDFSYVVIFELFVVQVKSDRIESKVWIRSDPKIKIFELFR